MNSRTVHLMPLVFMLALAAVKTAFAQTTIPDLNATANPTTSTATSESTTTLTTASATSAETTAPVSTTVQGTTCADRKVLFHCADNTCIERKNFCNNETDCPDGSDEIVYDNATHAGQGVKCQFRADRDIKEKWCNLPLKYKCDHELDCVNGYDECGCNHTYTCETEGCVLKVSFCDGKNDCADGSDETKFNRTTKVGFQCPVTRTHNTNDCILPDRYICDGDSDCDNGIDECFCEFTPGVKKGKYLKDVYSNDACFRCLDGSLVIPKKFVCDGKVHCEDLSDECLCAKSNRSAICNSVCTGSNCNCQGSLHCKPLINGTEGQEAICINSTSVCDDTYDCSDRADEKYCVDLGQSIVCDDKKKKIKLHQLCNGPKDCDDASDEKYCGERTDYYCANYRKHLTFIQDWNNVTAAENNRLKDLLAMRALQFDYPLFVKKCDGIPTCGELDDECYANCSVTPGYCQFVSGFKEPFKCPVSGSLIIGKEVCDGKPTCNDTHPGISEDELFCPDRYYCKDKGAKRLPIHIPIKSQCDQIQDCGDQSDELNCSAKTHFYCDDGGALLFVPRKKVCDGTKDCRGGTDECQNCTNNAFSSDKKLIKSRVLIAFLWIIGLVSVVGNALVFLHQARNLIKPTGAQSPVATSNRILVLNLSLADIFVGIYLIALGIEDASVSEYCLIDQEWRSGSTCSALGAIALLGTETSVFILTIMTAYRLYLIVRPFQTQKTIVVKIAIVVAWFFSLLLTFVPFSASAADYFVSCVWFRNNEFVGYTCHPDLVSFTKQLVLHDKTGKFSEAVKSGYTWATMFDAMKLLNSSYVPERYFGYYSAHSVCLPRLFPDPKQDVSWGYSLFLVLLNFFAFVFILISYVIIYKSTTRNTQVSKASAEDRAASLQRKISRIVLTDFCCWMPICIMAFITVSGTHIDEVAYAVTAIILLPINSAMNPFLYSDILDIIWEKMLPVRNWFNSTVCGRKIQKARKTWKDRTNQPSEDTTNGRTKTTHALSSTQAQSSQAVSDNHSSDNLKSENQSSENMKPADTKL